MGSRSHSRSSLFLIELIIAIAFFALGSAVCVQAFAKARTVTAQARDLSFASSTVSSAVSVVRYTDGTLEAVQDYFPGAFADGEDIAVCYDGDFAPCEQDSAAYTLTIHTEDIALGRSAGVRMDGADGETLYELQVRWPEDGEVRHG